MSIPPSEASKEGLPDNTVQVIDDSFLNCPRGLGDQDLGIFGRSFRCWGWSFGVSSGLRFLGPGLYGLEFGVWGPLFTDKPESLFRVGVCWGWIWDSGLRLLEDNLVTVHPIRTVILDYNC